MRYPFSRASLALVFAFVAAGTTAHAANLFWDPNGGTAGTGGSGAWDTSSSFWRLDSDTGTLQTYTNSVGDMTANFGGTAGTVTIASGLSINANIVNVTSDNYVIAGSDASLNFDGTSPAINFGATGNNRVLTISTNITGSAGLTITRGGLGSNNSGVISLNGNNTYSGGTTISFPSNSLTLNLGSDTAFGTGAVSVSAGTTIAIRSTGTRVLANDFTQATASNLTFGDGASNNGNLSLGNWSKTSATGNTSITVNNRTTFASYTSSGAGVTKAGPGALVVTGNWTQSAGGPGLTISGGALAVAGTLTAPRASLGGGGQLGRNGTMTGTLSGGASNGMVSWGATSGGIFAYGSNATWGHSSNNLTFNANSGAALTWGGSTGFVASGQTLILGNNLSNGTVTVQNAVNLNGAVQTVQVDKGDTNTAGGADAVISGVLSNGGLTKTGQGTVVLSGANTYTGITQVQGGTFLVNGSLANSAVTVDAGATIGGSGSIAGAVSVNGRLSPGNSPGILTVTNDVDLNSGAQFVFELTADSASDRGVNFDGVNVSGALSIDAGVTSDLVFNGAASTVDFTSAFWQNNHTWLVFDNSSNPSLASGSIFDSITVSLDSNGASLTAGTFSWSQSGQDVFLNYQTVPEPRLSVLLAIGMFAVLGLRRQRR